MHPPSTPLSAGPAATPSVMSDAPIADTTASAGWTTFLVAIGASVAATVALVVTMPAMSDTAGVVETSPVVRVESTAQRHGLNRLAAQDSPVERRAVGLSARDGERGPWCRSWAQAI